jgi:GDP-L-fucose synthase
MKILVTGGTGMVGSAFKKYEKDGVVRVGSKDFNLTNYSDCCDMIEDAKPDVIIHLAAKVGGVKGNTDLIGEFFRDNILMNTNVLEASRVLGVKKVVSILSTCIYPDKCNYPLTEEQIHLGPPHESNYGYAYAKRMIHVQSRAYRQQWGCNYISVVPNNIYGEFDNFHTEHSHVLPAIIRKMYDAQLNGIEYVTLWGDGSPLREFTYSQDIADGLMLIARDYNSEEPINIGNCSEYSIKYVAEKIKKEIGFSGDIIWNTNMPSGQMKKPSSCDRFKNIYPEFEFTNLDDGLKKVCSWFKQSYPNVRGV